FQNGIKTDRDDLFVGFERSEVDSRMRTFYTRAGLETQFREQFRIVNSSSYDILSCRKNTRFTETSIRRCLYRVFDFRWLYYSREITSRPAWDVMQHMLHPNYCLLVSKQQAKTGFQHIFCADGLCDHSVLSLTSREITSVFPLFRYEETLLFSGKKNSLQQCSNFRPNFVKALAVTLNVQQQGRHGLPAGLTPEEIFQYLYAVFHS